MNRTGIWSGRYLPVTIANLTVVAIAAFDGLALIAALPAITEDLGDVAFLPWVNASYLAASAVAGIAAGPVIDALGARWTFRVTGAWFLIWSAAAAAAPTMPLLVVARTLQGLGGGLVIAVALAAVGLAYPHQLRPSAFAANSVVWGVMGFGGPAIAGALLAFGSWRLIFLVQLPLTVLALAVGWTTLPTAQAAGVRVRSDWWGIALLAGLTVGLVVGVSKFSDRVGWSVAGFAVAVACGLAAWRHSGRSKAPVVAREHIVRRPLRWVHLTTGLVLIAGLTADNYLPLYVQTTRGRSETLAAFSVVFLTVGWSGGSVVYSRWMTGLGEPAVIAIGARFGVPALAAAAASIAFEWPLGVVLVLFGAIGLSIGLVSTAGLTMLQAHSGAGEMGRVNSAHQFLRALSITCAVALGGAILLAAVQRQVGDVGAVRDALSGRDVAVSAETADALGTGMAWALGISSVIAVGCAIGAQRLVRSTRADAPARIST